MADMLDSPKDLNTIYRWPKGGKRVDDPAKVVQSLARDLDKLKKDAKKVGNDWRFDETSLRKLLNGAGRAVKGIADDWDAEYDALFAAHRTDWPVIENDARDRYRKLMDLEATEGMASPAFAKALKATIACLEVYRDALYDRETYAQMVAERMVAMQKAFQDAEGPTGALEGSVDPVLWGLKTFHGGSSTDKLIRDLIALRNVIGKRAGAVARLYELLPDEAGRHAADTNGERGRIDAALKTLYAMQGEKVLADVKDYLGGLFTAA